MKIGILTQPLTNNYGGILQNYAMQQVIIRLGHDPITIRLAHGWQNMTLGQFIRVYPKYIIYHLLQKLKGKASQLPEPIWKWRKNVEGIEAFIKKYICTTSFVSGKALKFDIIKEYQIEVLVVGSDQVWHGGLPYMNNVYFCGFARGKDIKRISYAASFGFDCWRGTEAQTSEAIELISQFSAVSVREEKGVELCDTYLHRKDAQWVLDPTLMIEKPDYLKLCQGIPERKESFVFAYILDMSDDKSKFIEEVANKLECKIHYLSVTKVKCEDSIENWLSMFRDARFVITDSYHGTVFSLIFQKDFLCIYNPDRGNSRMDSLKKITGLNDRFIKDLSDVSLEGVNYKEVSENINNKKKQSMAFLTNALR